MWVDKAWCDHCTVGVDHPLGQTIHIANPGNPSPADRKVSRYCGTARSINQRSILDQDIVFHGFLLADVTWLELL